MGMIILPKTLQGGQPAIAQDVMDDLDAIVARVNGALENDNIAPGADIEGSKFLDDSIASPKLEASILEAGGINSSITRRDYAEVLAESARTVATWGNPSGTGGPEISLTVPAGGALVAIFATAEVRDDDASGKALVGLHEATDIDIDGDAGTTDAAILGFNDTVGAIETAVYRRYFTAPGMQAGQAHGGEAPDEVGVRFLHRAGWLVFPASAGVRTYRMLYASSSGEMRAQNRKLWGVVLGGF